MTAEVNYHGVAGLRRAFAAPVAWLMMFQGFGSGLPFLLVNVTLTVWQREAGFSLAQIGLISMATWLYPLKFLWAPFVDRFQLPLLGRRRGWMCASQLGVALMLALMSMLDPVKAMPAFILCVLLATFFGATQDIVVDAYRIEIAPPGAQAALTATSTLGYRFALITSGAGALYLATLLGWQKTYAIMAALMALVAIITIFCPEPERHQDIPKSTLQEAFTAPFLDFFARHGWRYAAVLLLFVGMFKFPDQVIGVMSGPFYLDHGFSKADIATVSKLYGVWIGIAGAFLAGAGAAIFGVRPMLLIGVFGVAISNLCFVFMAQNPGEIWSFYLAISADNLAQGFAGVTLVTLMSQLTNPAHTATQFALLVSLANLPGKFLGSVSGFAVEAYGYTWFFIASSVTVLPAALLLWIAWRRLPVLEAKPT
jgi:MFS transporter, PAT family, beta-lactamase induction signal transducer AmpG